MLCDAPHDEQHVVAKAVDSILGETFSPRCLGSIVCLMGALVPVQTEEVKRSSQGWPVGPQPVYPVAQGVLVRLDHDLIPMECCLVQSRTANVKISVKFFKDFELKKNSTIQCFGKRPFKPKWPLIG